MGYIDKELKIKTAKGLAKYLNQLLDIDILVIKMPSCLRVIWATDSKLHTHDINASVIYVVQEHHIDETIKAISETLFV